MRLLRDLRLRRLRTTLTIPGIAIGIWALVVSGSMANEASDPVVHMRDGLVADHGAMAVTAPMAALPQAAMPSAA